MPQYTENTADMWNDVMADRSIKQSTRVKIFDSIRLLEISWYGNMSDLEFLQRIFNNELELLPSTDCRFKTMAEDVWQHRINNDDWPDDWVFSDSRLDLLNIEDDVFLRFLCEMAHPLVRKSPGEARGLVKIFNSVLSSDSWLLYEKDEIVGQPVFASKKSERIDLARLFAVLGIQPSVSLSEVKQAYRDLAAVWHPDRFANNERLQAKAQDQLKTINSAYQTLLQELSRQRHEEIYTEEPRQEWRDVSCWEQLLRELATRHPPTAHLLREATLGRIDRDAGTITVCFATGDIRHKFDGNSKRRKLVEGGINALFGLPLRLVCVHEENTEVISPT